MCLQPQTSVRDGSVLSTRTGVHRADLGVKNHECGIPTAGHTRHRSRRRRQRPTSVDTLLMRSRATARERSEPACLLGNWAMAGRACSRAAAPCAGTGGWITIASLQSKKGAPAQLGTSSLQLPALAIEASLTSRAYDDPPRGHRRDADLRRQRRRHPAGRACAGRAARHQPDPGAGGAAAAGERGRRADDPAARDLRGPQDQGRDHRGDPRLRRARGHGGAAGRRAGDRQPRSRTCSTASLASGPAPPSRTTGRRSASTPRSTWSSTSRSWTWRIQSCSPASSPG